MAKRQPKYDPSWGGKIKAGAVAAPPRAVRRAGGGRAPKYDPSWGGAVTNTPIARAQIEAQQPEPEGLLGQALDIVESVPSGMFQMGKDFVQEFGIEPWENLAEGISEGDLGKIGAGIPIIGPTAKAGVGVAKGFLGEKPDEDTPLSSAFGASFRRTTNRLTDPSQYGEAQDQGQLLGVILEDAANLSVVGAAGAKTVNSVSKGAAARAATARGEAESLAKAATKLEKEAADAAAQQASARAAAEKLGIPDPKVAAQVSDIDALAGSAQEAARVARVGADRAAVLADEALAEAGPYLRPYRALKGLQYLGDQGSFAPMRPYGIMAKGLGAVARKVVGSDARLSMALDGFVRHRGAAELRDEMLAIGEGINHEQAQALRLITRELGDDPVLFQAALLDLTGSGVALNRAIEVLRASGDDAAGKALLEQLAKDPELDVAPEALDLAVQIAAETADPTVVSKIRTAQDLYRQRIANPEGERFLNAWGARRQLSMEGLAQRQWNLEGTTVNPQKMAEVRERFLAEHAGLNERLGDQRAAADRLGAKIGLDEAQRGDLEAAFRQNPREGLRLATEWVEKSRSNPTLRGELHRLTRTGRDISDTALADALADKIVGAATNARVAAREPLLRRMTEGGEFLPIRSARLTKGNQRLMRGVERAAEARGVARESARMSERLHTLAGTLKRAPKDTVDRLVGAVEKVLRARTAAAQAKVVADDARQQIRTANEPRTPDQMPDHMVTADEFAERAGSLEQQVLDPSAEHARLVADAIDAGEGVPPWVLDDYKAIAEEVRDRAVEGIKRQQADLDARFSGYGRAKARVPEYRKVKAALDAQMKEARANVVLPADISRVLAGSRKARRAFLATPEGQAWKASRDVVQAVYDSVTDLVDTQLYELEGMADAMIEGGQTLGGKTGGVSFVPRDMAEDGLYLYAEQLGAPETGILDVMDQIRDGMSNQAWQRIQGEAAFRRAYTRLWNRLSPFAKRYMRRMTDAELAGQWEQYRNHGSFNLPAIEESLSQAGLNANWTARDIADLYGAQARLTEAASQWRRRGAVDHQIAADLINQLPEDLLAPLGGAERLERILQDGKASLDDLATDLYREQAAGRTLGLGDEAVALAETRAAQGLEADRSYEEFRGETVPRGQAPGRQALNPQERLLADAEVASARVAGPERELIGVAEQAGSRRAGERLGVEASKSGERAAKYEAEGIESAIEAEHHAVAGIGSRAYKEGLSEGAKVERYKRALRDVGYTEARIARVPERLAREVDRLMADFRNAPARARPALLISRKAGRILSEWGDEVAEIDPSLSLVFDQVQVELLRNLKDIFEPGHVAGPDGTMTSLDPLFDPEFVPGGRPRDGEFVPSGPEAPPLRRRLAAEQHQKLSTLMARTPGEMELVLRRRTYRRVMNETARAVEARFGMRANRVLDEQSIEGLREAADGNPSVYGAALRDAMNDRGYVAWDPERLYEVVTEASAINDATVFITADMQRSFKRWFAPNGRYEQFFRQFYDKPTNAWKAAVLALTPRWHLNNLVGNAILAMTVGGMDPITYARRIKQARSVLMADEFRFEAAHPEAITRRGPMAARRTAKAVEKSPARLAKNEATIRTIEPEALAAMGGPEKLLVDPRLPQRGAGAALLDPYSGQAGPKTPVGKGISRSYEFNGYIDDMNRVAVFLEQHKKLSVKDIADYANLHPTTAARLNPAQLRDEAAVALSLRAMGNFTKMAPFERQVVRRILPFYAWLRHITQVAYRLPKYDPLRVVWMMHLADMFGDPAEFDLLKSTLPLGGDEFLRLPRFNPFEDAPISGDVRQTIGRNLNPIIKLGLAGIAGIDANTLDQMRRPPGTGELDDLGREKATPLLGDLGALAYVASSQFPQVRALRGLEQAANGEGEPLRYPTGDPMRFPKTGVPIPGGSDAIDQISALLGIPYSQNIDVEQLRITEAKRRKAAEAARQRYFGPTLAPTG